jgi:hypothetical protein
MISTYLSGGLGNQLFQIAAAYSLALDNNDICSFDLYNGHFTQKPAYVYKDNILNQINLFDSNQVKFNFNYKEPSFNYGRLPYLKNMKLEGYFQSEKYFIKNKDKVISLFRNEEILNNLKEKFKEILINSLSIHIRRTDYLEKQDFHTNQNIKYFIEAIKYIDNKKLIEHILIFSDDINWCKENFKDERVIFIENTDDVTDFYLMSLCENNIITNSSFSWWASYLNLNKDKIVICPKQWFSEKTKLNWKDIYYENTIIL